MKRVLFAVIFMLTTLYYPLAQAELSLELTQGMSAALPIAVIPFSGQQPNASDNISNIINSDLANSGQFRVTNSSNLPQYPNNVASIDKNIWQSKKIDNVVVGSLVPVGGDRYQVDVALVNVFQPNGVLIHQNFTVTSQQLRALAHHISDMIYEKLTGNRGIFSTKISYIVVQRNGKQAKYYLEVADFDGRNNQSLLVSNEPIMSPAWSPDGKRIAYVSFEKGRSQIYIQNLATGQRQVVSDSQGINGAPAWSPDGSKLALVLSKSGVANIYVKNLVTNQLQQLTNNSAIDTEPSWSPDGRSLIFTSSRGGTPQIYQMNLASNNISRVTFSGNYNARGSFSPDGKDIVMIHRDSGSFDIALQGLTDDRPRILTSSGQDESPSMSPNGKMVLYATRFGNRGVLALVSTDGSIRMRLPSREGNVQEPAWSPFLS